MPSKDPEHLREMRRQIEERLAEVEEGLLAESVDDPDLYQSQQEKINQRSRQHSKERAAEERRQAEQEVRELLDPLTTEQLRGVLDGDLRMDHHAVRDVFGGRLVEHDEAKERAREAIRAELRRREQDPAPDGGIPSTVPIGGVDVPVWAVAGIALLVGFAATVGEEQDE